MGTLGFIDPANGGVAWPPIVEQTRVAIRMCPHLCDGIRLRDAVPELNLQAPRCGFFNGGLWPSLLNGISLLKDVAESLNQWAVAN